MESPERRSGPISMDIAVSPHAAKDQEISRERSKEMATSCWYRDLEAGNILIKGLMYLTNDIRSRGCRDGIKGSADSYIAGDDHDTKYYSIVLSSLISQFIQV